MTREGALKITFGLVIAVFCSITRHRRFTRPSKFGHGRPIGWPLFHARYFPPHWRCKSAAPRSLIPSQHGSKVVASTARFHGRPGIVKSLPNARSLVGLGCACCHGLGLIALAPASSRLSQAFRVRRIDPPLRVPSDGLSVRAVDRNTPISLKTILSVIALYFEVTPLHTQDATGNGGICTGNTK